jgi:hypothetical protein
MDWETTRKNYLSKLERAIAGLDLANDLCSRVPDDVPSQVHKALKDLSPQFRRQLHKLRENQFQVAVIGIEKAGKSLLLNGWLGVEVLPSMDERCTYTATEVRSAESGEEQYYTVHYYTQAEFDEQVDQKRTTRRKMQEDGLEKTNEYLVLNNDLEEIDSLRMRIDKFLGEDSYVQPFADIQEVRDDLKKIVSTDKAQARAAKRVIVKTTRLRQARDIVFHDVPGFDSPVEIHKAMAKEKLAFCDAIIYAREARRPDLVGPEEQMLKVVDSEDPTIGVAKKTFVGLTLIDNASSREQHLSRVNKARERWTVKGVPERRIVPVCAPAHLYSKGTASPDVAEIGKEAAEKLSKWGVSNGIDELKSEVNRYLDNDRAGVLAERCDALIKSLTESTDRLIDALAVNYPETPEEVDQAREDYIEDRIRSWWKLEWEKIKNDFMRFYKADIRRKEHPDEIVQREDEANLESFREKYNELVDRLLGNLESASPERIRELYFVEGAGPNLAKLATKAHIKCREAISREAMVKVEIISKSLASTLEGIVLRMADWLVDRLYGLEDVRRILGIDNEALHERTKHGMSTLFLRFARPGVNLFLYTPRAVNRLEVIKEYKRDLAVLAEYYDGPDPSHRNLLTYLETGRWTSPSRDDSEKGFVEDKDKESPGNDTWWLDDEEEEPDPRAESPEKLDHPIRVEPATSVDDIVREINEDVTALINYLKNSLFAASGFESYCIHELDRVRYRFVELEEFHDKWYLRVKAAHRRNHKRVCDALGPLERDYEFRREVAQELKGLREAMAQTKD